MAITTNRIVKRTLAGLIAAASLTMGMAATANAASPTNVDVSNKESITVTATRSGAFTGKTDTIQAIELGKYLSAQSTDGGQTISAVGVDTPTTYRQALVDALTAAGVKNIDKDNPLNTVLDVTGDNGKDKPAYSSDLRALATSLNNNATIKAATGAKGKVSSSGNGKTDDVLTFSNLEAGYYLIRDTTASGKTAAIPMLVGTKAGGKSFANNPLGVVVYKSIDDNQGGNGNGNENVKPPVKSAGNGQGTEQHKVGDTVNYTVKAWVPNTTGYPGYRFQLVDTLGAGLDYTTGSYKVTVGGKALDAKYVKFYQGTQNKRELHWEFGLDHAITGNTVRDILQGDAKTIFTPGAEVVVTYSATINSDVTDSTANAQNKVEMDYSNNPNAWSEPAGKKPGENPDTPGQDKPVEVLLGQADIKATENIDKNNAQSVQSAKPLQGVKFQVGQYTNGGAFTALKFVANADGSYTLADADDTNTVSEFTTPASGVITLKGISGNYQVKQTAAATGWSDVYLADFVFNSAATKTAKTATLNADQTLNKRSLAYQINADTIGFMSVKNKTQLPNTGSSMGAILMVVSGVAVAGGVALAFKYRKQEA